MSYANMTKAQVSVGAIQPTRRERLRADSARVLIAHVPGTQSDCRSARKEKAGKAKEKGKTYKPDGARIARRRYNVGKIWSALDVNERTEQLADAYRLKDATGGDMVRSDFLPARER